jgi:hypothetical protein
MSTEATSLTTATPGPQRSKGDFADAWLRFERALHGS